MIGNKLDSDHSSIFIFFY